jgi:large subunit ribosomal protein L16
MLAPKRIKFRKQFKGRTKGIATRGNTVAFGEFGLQGNPEGWVAVVKPGRVLFEIEGISQDLAKKALALASAKLPVRTRFVKREEV